MPPVLRVQPARARAIVGDPVTARPYRMPRIIFKLWLEAESFVRPELPPPKHDAGFDETSLLRRYRK